VAILGPLVSVADKALSNRTTGFDGSQMGKRELKYLLNAIIKGIYTNLCFQTLFTDKAT